MRQASDMPIRPDLRPERFRGPYSPARDLAQGFAERLEYLRLEAGLTVRELAAGSGLPPGTVQALRSGKQQPNLGQLLALQRGLSCGSVEELLGVLPSLEFES